MPGMITTRLPYTKYCLTIWRAKNSEWQREWKNSISKLKYVKPRKEERESVHSCCRQYEVKLSKLHLGHTRLTHGHLMSRDYQQPACRNTGCGNQTITVKHCLQDCPQMRKETQHTGRYKKDTRKVANIMKFLKEMNSYELRDIKNMNKNSIL